MMNPKKCKEMKLWHECYQEGYNEGFKKGMEVARNSFAYNGRSRSSILGSRKYGKSALLHNEIENIAKEDLKKSMIQDDCVCDMGIFSCDSSCDCDGDCNCD